MRESLCPREETLTQHPVHEMASRMAQSPGHTRLRAQAQALSGSPTAPQDRLRKGPASGEQSQQPGQRCARAPACQEDNPSQLGQFPALHSISQTFNEGFHRSYCSNTRTTFHVPVKAAAAHGFRRNPAKRSRLVVASAGRQASHWHRAPSCPGPSATAAGPELQ